jgi:hypothetical protein
MNLTLLHNPLGHRALNTLLAADEHKIWSDARIQVEPKTDCTTCKLATFRAHLSLAAPKCQDSIHLAE